MLSRLESGLRTGILLRTRRLKKFLFSCYFKKFRHLAHLKPGMKSEIPRYFSGRGRRCKGGYWHR